MRQLSWPKTPPNQQPTTPSPAPMESDDPLDLTSFRPSQIVDDENPVHEIMFGDLEIKTPPPSPPAFMIGPGRSGSHFLQAVMAGSDNLLALHFDQIYPFADSFTHYSKFHSLPLDIGGFVWSRRCLVERAALKGKSYFEASPLSSLMIEDLDRSFDKAVFIFLVRDPVNTVASMVARHNYRRRFAVDNPDLISGYQYNTPRPATYFGSQGPRGKEEFERWVRLTEIGKTSWYWRTVCEKALEQFDRIADGRKRIIRIEDFDYEQYLRLTELFAFKPIPKPDFDGLRVDPPGKTGNTRPLVDYEDWSIDARREFQEETSELAERFGYQLTKP
ncbi:MAG: hypothetical protein HQ494_02295 [Rhodospirillales bacterium]|nr:hypothetical protein [Rhodospirillales bacterium]